MSKKNKFTDKDFDKSTETTSATSKQSSSKAKPSFKKNGKRSFAKTAASSSTTSSAPTGFPHANDPSWRLQTPALSQNVGAILFSDPTGKIYKDSVLYNDLTYPVTWSTTGIMVFDALPLWGEATGASSPTNVAGQKIQWLANVKWYSSVGYAPSDIMAMVMAVDTLHIFITEAIRAYACCSKYSVQNQYFGRTLVRALGWDYDDILANLAQFRTAINDAIVKINMVHIPNVFYCIDSHRTMYSRIFTESPTLNEKGQLYIFRSHSWWVWDDSLGTLTAKPWKFWKSTSSYTEYCNVEFFTRCVAQMLDPILTSEFIAKMDSDLQRVFTEQQCFVLPTIGDTLDIQFTYDPLVLCQIFNAEFVNAGIGEFEYMEQTKFPSFSHVSEVPVRPMYGTTALEPPVLFAQYVTHVGSRTDLLGSTIRLKQFLPLDGTSNTWQAFAQANQIPKHCLGAYAFHYFNILDILPKDPGVILEAAHYKFNIGTLTGDGYTAPKVMVPTDFQDSLIFGVRMVYMDKNSDGEKEPVEIGVLPEVALVEGVPNRYVGEYLISTLSRLWQFSMPPCTFVTDMTNQVSKPLTEVADMYVASKAELSQMNYVAVQSLWDTNRIPTSRKGGMSMN